MSFATSQRAWSSMNLPWAGARKSASVIGIVATTRSANHDSGSRRVRVKRASRSSMLLLKRLGCQSHRHRQGQRSSPIENLPASYRTSTLPQRAPLAVPGPRPGLRASPRRIHQRYSARDYARSVGRIRGLIRGWAVKHPNHAKKRGLSEERDDSVSGSQ